MWFFVGSGATTIFYFYLELKNKGDDFLILKLNNLMANDIDKT